MPSDDGELVVTSCAQVFRVDVTASEPSKQIKHVSKLESHVGAVTSVAWCHHKPSFASADAAGKLVVWSHQPPAGTWHEAAVLSRYEQE